MSNILGLNNLAEYLTWRDQQRIDYKQLSKKLRILKREIKATMKAGGMAGEMQISLIDLKIEARQIMELRQTAKQIARDSWEQWRGPRREQAA